MKKLIGVSLLMLGLAMLASPSHAANPARGAKSGYALNYTTTLSTVTVGPAVVYSIVMSTGASGEYVVFFDTAALGANVIGTTSGLKSRTFFASTTANTVVTFDPPLQFSRGLFVGDSAVTGQSLIIWEPGHVVQGY